jgi:hypothetical protein
LEGHHRRKATVFFICRCIREHGHGRSRGEAIGIKSAAGLGCLFIVHDDVVVFVDIVHDAGMWLERGRRTLGFFEGVRGECGVGPVPGMDEIVRLNEGI